VVTLRAPDRQSLLPGSDWRDLLSDTGRHHVRTVPVAAATPPPPAAPDPDRSVRTALPFLMTGLVSVLLVGLLSGVLSRSVAIDEAVGGAIESAQLAAREAVAPALTDGVLAGDPAAVAALDRAVRDGVLNVSLLRVKIWDETGRIVYSDESRLIGERFVLDADELAALHGGAAAAGVSDLSAPENRFEEPAVELLEVYLPLRTPAGAPVLFELYSRYEGVTAAARRIWVRFLPLDIGALLLLELLQLPIAAALGRRLRRARSQREDVMRQALSAVDDERARIARDLHDGVVQDLAGVAFTLAAAARAGRGSSVGPGRVGPGLVGPGQVGPGQLGEAADRVRRSVRALRSLVVEIYPPNLYEEGLAAALSDVLARLVPPDTEVGLEVDAMLPVLRTDQTELVYRVAQEGLRNVVRHAAARSVRVSLRREGVLLVLLVSDDGSGCDPTRLVALPGHLGLRALGGMADAAGATLSLESAPGRGTTVRLEVPL
jgi:two-component system NarL family sensor kinase